MIKACLLMLIIVFSAYATLFAQKKQRTSYIKISDINYSGIAEKAELNILDVYMPTKGSSSPILIWIDGAVGNDDKENVQKAEYFTRMGYAFISINYRSTSSLVYAAQAVSNAIVWVHTNAQHYSADASKIFLLGHGVGADLAALVSVNENYLAIAGGSLTMIKGVVLLDGSGYDVQVLMADARSQQKDHYVKVFGNSKQEWDQVSPSNFVETGKSIPPFMIAYTGDHGASETEAKILSRRLGEAAIENKVFSYAKKNHQTISRELGEEGDKTTEDVLRFLLEKNYVAVHPIR